MAKTTLKIINDAWLKALVNKELDKAFARVYAKHAKAQKAAKKVAAAKKPSFIGLTVKAYAAKGWANWNKSPKEVTGKIPAAFGKYHGVLGGGHQNAAHKLGTKYVLKIQHHFAKDKAEKYIEKLNFIKEKKYDGVVGVHAAGFFGETEANGLHHYYTYEVLDRLEQGGYCDADNQLWKDLGRQNLEHTDAHGGNIMKGKDGKFRVIDLESLVIRDENRNVIYGHNGRREE